MDIHKDCYSAIDLTQQDGPHRRETSRDDKMRIIEETLAPGAVVTKIARRHGIAASLEFTWWRSARLATVASAGPRLVPVQATTPSAESVRSIEASAAMPARKRRGLIEIDLGNGKRVSVDENVDAEALERVLDVLRSASLPS
jgi:transposase